MLAASDPSLLAIPKRVGHDEVIPAVPIPLTAYRWHRRSRVVAIHEARQSLRSTGHFHPPIFSPAQDEHKESMSRIIFRFRVAWANRCLLCLLHPTHGREVAS